MHTTNHSQRSFWEIFNIKIKKINDTKNQTVSKMVKTRTKNYGPDNRIPGRHHTKCIKLMLKTLYPGGVMSERFVFNATGLDTTGSWSKFGSTTAFGSRPPLSIERMSPTIELGSKLLRARQENSTVPQMPVTVLEAFNKMFPEGTHYHTFQVVYDIATQCKVQAKTSELREINEWLSSFEF